MRMYNFIFSNKVAIRILRHVCFWFCWYLYHVMLFLYNNTNVQDSFWVNLEVRCLKLLRVFPFGMIQCYIVIYWLIPKFLYKKKYPLFIIGFIVSAISVIYFVDIVTYNRFDFLSVWMGIVSYTTRAGPVLCLVFFIIKMLKHGTLKSRKKIRF